MVQDNREDKLQSNRPNILFILVDDLGWRDLGCYGSYFYETPNIDRLAEQGVRFTDAYAAAPVCSPTRASIMSGKYPANVGVTNFIGSNHPSRGKLIDAPYVDHLPAEETSIAQALKEGGYRTWHVGKWHLGDEPYYPDRHGFDVNVGGCSWGMPMNGYFSPWGIETLEEEAEGEYLTDRLTKEAVQLIEGQAGEEAPFFLNMDYYTVHIPIQGKEEYVEKYRKKREMMGLTEDQVKTFDIGKRYPCEHKKDRRIRRRLVQSDPSYAAMVQSLDESVGELMEALERTGQMENTAIFFTSDNGGLATAEGSPTCNSPLAEGKGWMYEGGVREPLIVSWPGKVEADSFCKEPVSSPDFYPTLLDVAGFPPLPEQSEDGESLMPLLEGEKALEREALYWHYPHYGNQGGTPGCSIRMGDWKLIEFFEDGSLELYNLREDLREEEDLAEAERGKAREMHERLIAWREEIEAKLPQPTPGFEPWREE